jgi:hypothetical protein
VCEANMWNNKLKNINWIFVGEFVSSVPNQNSYLISLISQEFRISKKTFQFQLLISTCYGTIFGSIHLSAVKKLLPKGLNNIQIQNCIRNFINILTVVTLRISCWWTLESAQVAVDFSFYDCKCSKFSYHQEHISHHWLCNFSHLVATFQKQSLRSFPTHTYGKRKCHVKPPTSYNRMQN